MIVAGVALILNFGLAFARGIGRGMNSDAAYYLQLAENLSAGKGYVLTHDTYWPNQPTMRRLPGWPLLTAAGLRLIPGDATATKMRIVALLTNVAAACMLCILTYGLIRDPVISALAGLLYAAHPAALHFADVGLSEPLFVLLVASGVCCLFRGGWWIAGGLLLEGLACLVRANFVLWLPLVALGAAVYQLWKKPPRLPARAPILIAGAVLFLLPPLAWTARNYQHTGAFPVLSTLRGQTFYGGNNSVTANDFRMWGYWVFPDQIPGQTPMAELARSHSEHELDRYYYGKGKEYIAGNLSDMPRLLLGKLVRAYVPIPFVPRLDSYIASLYRWLLYAGALMGLIAAWRTTRPAYAISLTAMMITNLAVVLLFWGYVRFAFALEVFFLPYTAVAVMTFVRRRRDQAPE